MDSRILAAMLRFIQNQQKNVNSILIVRNGYLVTEAYFAPHTRDSEHHLYSATKSVTSILVGIALKDGAIASIHQRVLDFFPELAGINRDPRMQAMTLEHVLEMKTGIDWSESAAPYGAPRNIVSQMESSSDWIRFVLSRPMVAEPGTKFDYSSGASHLLSAIIQRQTGMTASSYAQVRLFEPLGISDVYWTADPHGITTGGWGLYLTPRDMAKVGLLYLNRGIWDGAEVVQPQWVDASVTKHATVIAGTDLRYRLAALLGRVLRRDSVPLTKMDYGYHWWLPPFGGYAALGYAGQAIFVVPDLNLVAVITGGLPSGDAFLREKLMESFIIPAVKSPGALNPDAPAFSDLQSVLQGIEQPKPQPVPVLPEAARLISGKTYVLEQNTSGLQALSLQFDGSSRAQLKVLLGNQDLELPMGLDNVFHSSKVDKHNLVALRGAWSNSNTFVVDWRSLAAGDRIQMAFTFAGDTLTILSRTLITGASQRIVGRQR